MLADWLPDLRRWIDRRAPRALLQQESSSDLAQSVVREALVRIRRGTVNYQGEAEFRAWLIGATDIKIQARWKHLRTQRRDGALDPKLDVHDADLRGSATSPSGAFAKSERSLRFAQLLGRLDERSATIVRCIYLEGKSHAETAAALGIEIGTCRTALSRALARLTTLAQE